MKQSGLSLEELSEKAAVELITLRRIAKGYQKAGKHTMVSIRAATRHDVSNVLLPGKPTLRVREESPRLRFIPVVSWAQAGDAVSYEDLPAEWMDRINSDACDPNAFAVSIKGDSMEPKYREGQIAVLLPSLRPQNGDLVVARLKKGPVYFKRFHLVRGTIQLTSYNPIYPPMEFVEKDFHWIYVVDEMRERIRRR